MMELIKSMPRKEKLMGIAFALYFPAAILALAVILPN